MVNPSEKTFMFLSEIGTYLLVNTPDRFKSILLGEIPSLDGMGKMSKSKGDKKNIYLDDNLETIKKKVSKIPSNEKGYPAFFGLWYHLMDQEKKEKLCLEISSKAIKYLC